MAEGAMKVITRITLHKNIGEFKKGTYQVVYASQFISSGQMHHMDAEQLVNQYGKKVSATYDDLDNLVSTDGPRL
jgi:hypothetical protein